jgi:cysteine peptidase C11 family protein
MPAKWTFMVYVAGYNNLSPFATKDLEEMRKVGSSSTVKVAAFVKQLNGGGAHHILVGKNGQGELREDVGDKDSGSPQTMIDFIHWAKAKAPAERYALVVWNHGSGWDPLDFDQLYSDIRAARGRNGFNPRELTDRSRSQLGRSVFTPSVVQVLSLDNALQRAIASDDGTGHSLDTIELARVVKRAHEELDVPLELLGMDACLMSCLEVAFEAEHDLNAIVGSEELEPGDGWPYADILADLAAHPEMDGAALGKAVVDRYIASYEQREDQWPVTMCAIHAKGIDPFSKALDTLSRALRDAIAGSEDDANRLMRAHVRSVAFDGDLVDLRSFCAQLATSFLDQPVKDAARAVAEALKPGAYVIAEGHLGDKVKPCGGVTVYFPVPPGNVSPYYKDLRFARRHKWDEFLRAYHRAVKG